MCADLRGGLLLAFVVLHQQARDGGAERRLPRLQREPDLRARFVFFAVLRQREHAIDGVPELRERAGRGIAAAPACGASPARSSSALQRVVEIGADALELRGPGGQRIGLGRCRACRAWPARANSDRSGCAGAGASRCDCDRRDCSAARAGRRSAALCTRSRRRRRRA